MLRNIVNIQEAPWPGEARRAVQPSAERRQYLQDRSAMPNRADRISDSHVAATVISPRGREGPDLL
jgi:hypothetical protein